MNFLMAGHHATGQMPTRHGGSSCALLDPLQSTFPNLLTPRFTSETMPHVEVDIESWAHPHICLVAARCPLKKRLRASGIDEGVLRGMKGDEGRAHLLQSSVHEPIAHAQITPRCSHAYVPMICQRIFVALPLRVREHGVPGTRPDRKGGHHMVKEIDKLGHVPVRNEERHFLFLDVLQAQHWSKEHGSTEECGVQLRHSDGASPTHRYSQDKGGQTGKLCVLLEPIEASQCILWQVIKGIEIAPQAVQTLGAAMALVIRRTNHVTRINQT
mmetsp:Transcript_20948/g.55884  ORF Transcript_20948/g.55884 Transcript_20948/m.55884 type:complete len:271 (+) Transcript_20948:238-1050(+)|eukprot:CAMPEP_0194517950 /NCGR_PEP_ID=MMETSP0253-20130528/51263_1 /TAXON_ID=2966 /ORGANISM="Noctiluca scintillans" /LENGTH=270 /DNA_ID=CAMNT_0039361965 /DNA_START=194 /DNA_END=1006 /DNA_ORIENTATION=-